jgi:hypothetical protein
MHRRQMVRFYSAPGRVCQLAMPLASPWLCSCKLMPSQPCTAGYISSAASQRCRQVKSHWSSVYILVSMQRHAPSVTARRPSSWRYRHAPRTNPLRCSSVAHSAQHDGEKDSRALPFCACACHARCWRHSCDLRSSMHSCAFVTLVIVCYLDSYCQFRRFDSAGMG